MIFDWYNGGDWGGLPVRRLGHIMADVVNGCQAVALVGDRFPVSFDGVLPEFQDGTGAAIASPEAADYNGLSIDSPVILHNFRQALLFLRAIAAYEYEGGSAFWWAEGPTGDATVSEATLGIQDLTEDSLTKLQQVQPWATLRTALERLRYLRYIQTSVNLTAEVKMQTLYNFQSINEPAEVYAELSDNILEKMNEVIAATSQKADPGPVGPIIKSAAARAYETLVAPDIKRHVFCFQKNTPTSVAYSLIGGLEGRMPNFALTEGWITFEGSGPGADGIDVFVGENESRIEDGSRISVPLETGLLQIYDNDTTLHTVTGYTETEWGDVGRIGFAATISLVEATYDTDEPMGAS